ncbi:hypothetical protein ANN_25258 [Periplaneta americana]|uniref:RNase H type-1 domain-containing protein n=1 Tax=Periplaneta americana TaxID=6978 RepID=A0ABQ8S168_PERAM|nr:hypothetical protein ANN_25258 [Periplaneta americana]
MLSQLISLNKRIVFQWIPSHCGILGNENADALAKKGSRPVTKSTYYSVKRFIKSTYLDFNKQNLITQSQGKKWNSLHQNPQLIPDLPRKSSVAAFRLATGHDCLAKHLHRIGIYQSPNCPLCNSNQEMDSEHLKICASVAGHDNIFEKYWSARGQMNVLNAINLVDKFRATEKKKSVTWPTKMTDDAVEDARERMQRGLNKSVKKLAVEIGVSYGSARKILKNKLDYKMMNVRQFYAEVRHFSSDGTTFAFHLSANPGSETFDPETGFIVATFPSEKGMYWSHLIRRAGGLKLEYKERLMYHVGAMALSITAVATATAHSHVTTASKQLKIVNRYEDE